MVPDINSASDAALSLLDAFSRSLPRKRNVWGNPIRSHVSNILEALSPAEVSHQELTAIDEARIRSLSNTQKMRKKTSFEGIDVNFFRWPRMYETHLQITGGGKEIDPELRFWARAVGRRAFGVDRTTFEVLDDAARQNGLGQSPDEVAANINVALSRARHAAWEILLGAEVEGKTFGEGDERVEEFRRYVAEQAILQKIRAKLPRPLSPNPRLVGEPRELGGELP